MPVWAGDSVDVKQWRDSHNQPSRTMCTASEEQTGMKNRIEMFFKMSEWATFRPTKFKTHYVAPQFFIFRWTVQIAPKISFIEICIYFSFGLTPTGHSQFHNTSNHPPPATDSSRTARTPLYPPVQAVPPYFLPPFFPVRDRWPVPVRMTGIRYNSLLWMWTLNTLTWPDLRCQHNILMLLA